MPVVEGRLSLLEVKMEEVGTTLVRIEAVPVGHRHPDDNPHRFRGRAFRNCREADLIQ